MQTAKTQITIYINPDQFSFLGLCNCSMFGCILLCVHSSFALLMGKRELVALLFLSFWCVALPHGVTG